jgi:hypothetical protein
LIQSAKESQPLEKISFLGRQLVNLLPKLAWNQDWNIHFRFTNIVFLAALIPTLLSESGGIKSERIYLYSLIEKILLWATFLGLVAFFNFALLKRKVGRTNLFEVVSLGFMAGLITAVLDVTYQKILGLIQIEYYSFSKILSLALTGALWIPIGSALMQAPLEVRAKKAKALQDLEKLRRSQIRHTDTLKEIQKQINADFELRLQSTVSELKVKTPQLDIFNKKPDMTQYLNKEIAQWNLTAIQTMRQLSHEFAIANSTKSLRWVENPRRIFWRILAIIDSFSTSIKSAPTSPYLFTAMVGSLIAYPILRGQSFQGGVVRFFTVFSLIFLVQSTIFTIRKRLRPGWWFLDILGLVFIMILPWIIPFFSVIDNTKQAHNNKRIIFDITIVLIFMAIHIAQSYVISGEEIIRVLNRQNSENLIREKLTSEQVAILSRNWAEHVHGRLVTRLTSASILLEREGPKGDSESTIAALDIISDALHDENSNLTEVEVERNLGEEIGFRVEPWSGIVDIHVNFESKCKSKKSSRLSEIGVLVEEAISNSVRHGDSTAIDLSIAMANRSELLIRVVDDSKGPVPADISESESRSLGLLIYDSVSDGNWTLEHDSQKKATTFQARISLI